jgi:hypothetical protein
VEPRGRWRSLRARAEVWPYRRLRPVVAERQERPLPPIAGPKIPEPSRRPGGLARYKRLAAAAATGETVIGYGQGYEAAELDAMMRGAPLELGGLPGWAEDVCAERAVPASEGLRECRAEQQLRVAGLLAETENDRWGE